MISPNAQYVLDQSYPDWIGSRVLGASQYDGMVLDPVSVVRFIGGQCCG